MRNGLTITLSSFENSMKLTPPKVAEYLEGVTDKIEDCADFIKVLAIKSK